MDYTQTIEESIQIFLLNRSRNLFNDETVKKDTLITKISSKGAVNNLTKPKKVFPKKITIILKVTIQWKIKSKKTIRLSIIHLPGENFQKKNK